MNSTVEFKQSSPWAPRILGPPAHPLALLAPEGKNKRKTMKGNVLFLQEHILGVVSVNTRQTDRQT